jgi:uncharacterized surface protein with fasciclin (FAS1) repeats
MFYKNYPITNSEKAMNLKRLLTFTKRALLAAVVLTTVTITGCDNSNDNGTKAFDGTTLALIQDAQFKQSATVSADVALDSLVKYLAIYPDLTSLLSGSAEYTLFAPSNTAFVNLIGTPGFPKNIKLISPDLIKSVLAYHFIEGKKLQADLTAGTVLSTQYTDPSAPSAPQKITVNANGTLIAAPNAANTDINIVKADLQSNNGVVHIIESVMIPPSTGAVLVPILGTVAGAVLLGKDFTHLAKIILAADASFTENPANYQFKVSKWLAMPISTDALQTPNQKGITFFAPPNSILGNDVLSEATANAIIGSEDKGRSFLLNHLVVSGMYTVGAPPANNTYGITQFPAGLSQITPLSGKTITVNVGEASQTNPYGVVLFNVANPTANDYRPIVSKDNAYNNGYLQVIAGPLL